MLDEMKFQTPAGAERERHYIPAKGKADIYADGRVFRTCAYCRVSTDSDMQLSSFELQTEHYQNLAGKHPNWELRKIYADACAIIALTGKTLTAKGVAPL